MLQARWQFMHEAFYNTVFIWEKSFWWMWRLWEDDRSLTLSPQAKKSELLMCCLTLCVPSPCEAFTEQLSLWPAPLTPPTSPGSPQAAWQEEHFVCPHIPLLTTHTHTHIFSDFSLCDLYFFRSHTLHALLLSKVRSSKRNLSGGQVFFSRPAWKGHWRTENSISYSACNTDYFIVEWE